MLLHSIMLCLTKKTLIYFLFETNEASVIQTKCFMLTKYLFSFIKI